MKAHSQDKIEKLEDEIIQEVESSNTSDDVVVASSSRIIDSETRHDYEGDKDVLHVDVVIDEGIIGLKPDSCYHIKADNDYLVLKCSKEIPRGDN